MNDAGLNIGACRCSDWLPDASSLDEVWAWRLLDGLARADALQMLADNPLTLVEALQYANGKCFIHYSGLLADYLLSEDAKSNFAAAAGFLDLLISRKPDSSIKVGLNNVSFLEAAQMVSERQPFYEADEDIYGMFGDKYLKYVSSS